MTTSPATPLLQSLAQWVLTVNEVDWFALRILSGETSLEPVDIVTRKNAICDLVGCGQPVKVGSPKYQYRSLDRCQSFKWHACESCTQAIRERTEAVLMVGEQLAAVESDRDYAK